MERLQKVIAAAGIASRRKAEQLILDGRVEVNDQIVTTLGVKVGKKDQVRVDGQMLLQEEKCYYMLNKPKGYVSAVSDDKDRRVVTELLSDVTERIYPIGRLDYNTSGLLLLTNDGEFANLMMHPKYKIAKTYIALIDGYLSREQIRTMKAGIVLEDGYKTGKAEIKVIHFDKAHDTSKVQITIYEGRNHQVRKMFAAIGKTVKSLNRTTFGFLQLDHIPKGHYRPLTKQEVKRLYIIATQKQAEYE